MANVNVCVPVLAPDGDLKSECWQRKNNRNLYSKVRCNSDKRTTYELDGRSVSEIDAVILPACVYVSVGPYIETFVWTPRLNDRIGSWEFRDGTTVYVINLRNGYHLSSSLLRPLYSYRGIFDYFWRAVKIDRIPKSYARYSQRNSIYGDYEGSAAFCLLQLAVIFPYVNCSCVTAHNIVCADPKV